MQAEARLAVVLFEHFVVQVHVVPVLEHLGLPLGKAGTHGEVCFRQIDRGVEIVLGHGSIFLLSELYFHQKLRRAVRHRPSRPG